MKHKRAVLRRYPGAFAEQGEKGTWIIWAPWPSPSRWRCTMLLGAARCKTEDEAWQKARARMNDRGI